MRSLPLANVLHHKLRSALSILGIGIGVCMLITLSGLARGSLSEVADRWESVDADLIGYSDVLGENITTLAGVAISDRYAERLARRGGDIVQAVVPVFLWQMKLAGQNNVVAGVDPASLPTLTGRLPMEAGRCFDPEGKFSNWLTQVLVEPAADDGLFDPDLAQAPHPALEMVVDSRLAGAAGYRVGDIVPAAGHEWRIVGIVQAGGLARAYIPRRTAQFLFAGADITKSTLLFVKLADGVPTRDAIGKLAAPGLRLVPISQYRMMLRQRFAVMYHYVDTVNAITMAVAFLFIMIVLYTMVLQQRREIAILRSCGASRAFLLRQVLAEAGILAGAGLAVGVVGSFSAAWAIEAAQPLLTVTILPQRIAIAAGATGVGAALSGLYPAWTAMRVDMVEALSLE